MAHVTDNLADINLSLEGSMVVPDCDVRFADATDADDTVSLAKSVKN